MSNSHVIDVELLTLKICFHDIQQGWQTYGKHAKSGTQDNCAWHISCHYYEKKEIIHPAKSVKYPMTHLLKWKKAFPIQSNF